MGGVAAQLSWTRERELAPIDSLERRASADPWKAAGEGASERRPMGGDDVRECDETSHLHAVRGLVSRREKQKGVQGVHLNPPPGPLPILCIAIPCNRRILSACLPA